MASNYPSSLDSYITKVDNVDSVMAAHINDLQDAIEALEVKVGVDGSAIAGTIDYKVRNIPSQTTATVITNLNADKVDGADLSTDGTFASNSDVKVPSEKAVKTYAVPLTYLDTDGTLTANSDTKVATQKATKTYVDGKATDAGIVTTDVTTNNASTSKHGFLKKLSNVATEFMNGVGNWVSITIDSLLPSQTGNSGKFLTTNGSSASWAPVLTYPALSDSQSVMLASADTERLYTDAAYTKVKEITVVGAGTLSVSFDMRREGTGGTAYGRIYVNGVATGSERSTTSSSYATFTSTGISVSNGDKVQLYVKWTFASGGDYGYIRNFRLFATTCSINQD